MTTTSTTDDKNIGQDINNIIFLVTSHFSKRDFEQFGIELLIGNGFKVEVWNFMPFLRPEAYHKTCPPDLLDGENIRTFNYLKEATVAISNLSKDSFVVCRVSYILDSLEIYRAISRRKIAYCIRGFALPISTTASEQFIQRLRRFSFKKLVHKIFIMTPYRWLGVRPANLVLAMAEKYSTSGYPVNRNSRILWTHSYDFDTYLQHREDTFTQNGTAVFLDQDIAFHSDFIHSKVPSPVTSEQYYPLLCDYFDYLEKKTNVRVVIAAHPLSHYDKRLDLFGGREIVRGKTVKLVKDSTFVILHNSTAINFAILFNKPMLFITTDQINTGLAEDPSVNWLASFFGKKAHNLNNEFAVNLQEELAINHKAYDDYINAYIKKQGTEEISLWQIFANHLKTSSSSLFD